MPEPDTSQLSVPKMLLCIPLSGAFFLVVCLLSASTVKRAALYLTVLTLALVFLYFSSLRNRVTLPLLALALYVLMDGVSTLYAVSGKFALYEFLKILCAFCLTLILLAVAPGRGVESVRWIASIIEGFVALAALVSIDMISTHLLSDSFLTFLSGMTPDYLELAPLIPGTRINSIFMNPNVFAGISGIGVMLSLGLVMSSAEKKERFIHTSCLAVIALAFVLAFSMGGSGTIAVAFLVYLVLESRERRPRLFLLMAETLAATLLSAMVISATSFDAWETPRYIPLVCAVLDALALCILEAWINPKLTEKLRGHGRIAAAFLGGAAVLIAVYAVLAFNLTGPADIGPGKYLWRSAYPTPGEYVLDIQSDGPVTIRVLSYSRAEAMLHTYEQLYRGPAEAAVFTVPEGCLAVFFDIRSAEPVSVESLACVGNGDTVEVPLRYKLLPSFVARRLQGLFANRSVIQRLVFFEDGMKLFRRSPVVGLGLGSFESGLKSVQSCYYETKYLHNHYLQTLMDTGIVGLLLFLGVFVISGIFIWRARRKNAVHPMVPALGGALAFMAAHGGVEVDFSIYSYLPAAFVSFGLVGLCCQDEMTASKNKRFQNVAVLSISALLAIFGLLLSGNLRAASLTAQAPTMDDLVVAAELDKFEWADHMLSYVMSSMDEHVGEDIRIQADKYAQRLSRLNSNTVPLYLAEYYLSLGRTELGLKMLEKYTTYTASDSEAWQTAFDLLANYHEDSELFRSGVRRLAEQMETWNSENLGKVQVSEESMAFIDRMRS